MKVYTPVHTKYEEATKAEANKKNEVVVVWRDWIPRDRCSQLHFRYNIDTEKDHRLDKQLHRNKTILSFKQWCIRNVEK